MSAIANATRYIPVLVFRNLPLRITAMDKLFPVIPMIIRIRATTNIVIIIVEPKPGSLSALCSQFIVEQLQSEKTNPIHLCIHPSIPMSVSCIQHLSLKHNNHGWTERQPQRPMLFYANGWEWVWDRFASVTIDQHRSLTLSLPLTLPLTLGVVLPLDNSVRQIER